MLREEEQWCGVKREGDCLRVPVVVISSAPLWRGAIAVN
jgi:hypothetical protein